MYVELCWTLLVIVP